MHYTCAIFRRLTILAAICWRGLFAASTVDPSTLDGKVLIGYQGWFTCPADGSGRWAHWFRGTPAPDTLSVELYPDVSELDPEERCEIPGMTIGGNPAYLFSPRNPKTVMRYFQWMRQYWLDRSTGAAFCGRDRATAGGWRCSPEERHGSRAGDGPHVRHRVRCLRREPCNLCKDTRR